MRCPCGKQLVARLCKCCAAEVHNALSAWAGKMVMGVRARGCSQRFGCAVDFPFLEFGRSAFLCSSGVESTCAVTVSRDGSVRCRKDGWRTKERRKEGNSSQWEVGTTAPAAHGGRNVVFVGW